MRYKITSIFLLLVTAVCLLNAGDRYRIDKNQKMMDAVPFVNYAPYNTTPVSSVFLFPLAQGFSSDSITVGPEISTTLTGFYDYWTNGEVNLYLQVDPLSPNSVHAIHTYADSIDAAGSTSRRIRYGISTDGGTSWALVTEVPSGRRSGFGVLQLTSAGAAVIANHNQPSGQRLDAYLYVDIAPQAGTFTEYGHPPPPAPFGIWPQVAVYNNNNIGILSRRNVSGNEAAETLYYSVWNGASISARTPIYIANGPWQATVGSNMRFHIATNGAGLVTVIAAPVLQDDTLGNSRVYAITSTNNGTTWGSVQPVYRPYTISGSPDPDTISTAGGSGFVYKKNSNLWFLAMPVTKNGLFAEARLYLRKSNGDTTTICSASQVGAAATYQSSMAFVFSIDFPALGWSADGTTLYCTYSVVKPDTSRGFNQRDIYVSYSIDDGTTWSNPFRLTNTTNIDETYPSISYWNKGASGGPYEANISYMKDVGVGPTSFNGSGTTGPASLNTMIFRKLTGLPPIGINSNNSIVKEFSLSQNYPNPFNPSTRINFAVPYSSNVTLKVYDVMGRLVSTLIDNQSYKTGVYDIDFNAQDISSGIYFYTINAGEFTSTKKMILVK